MDTMLAPAPPEEHIQSKRQRGLLLILAAALALAGVLLYRARGLSFQWDLFFSTFAHVAWGWMSAAILVVFVTYIGRALRWQVMLWPIRQDANLWRINTATMIGFAAIVLLGRPGELVRPYLISVKEKTPFSAQMAAWLLERILDLLAVLLIFGFALSYIPAHETHVGGALQWVLRTGGYLVAGLGALALILLIAFRNFSGATETRILERRVVSPGKLHP